MAEKCVDAENNLDKRGDDGCKDVGSDDAGENRGGDVAEKCVDVRVDVDSNLDNRGDDAGHTTAEYSTPTMPSTSSQPDDTTESSQDSQLSTMVIPETPDQNDDVSSEGDDNELILPHDVYTVRCIKSTQVHFRLRRTTPTLWRHEATCFMAMRVFSAIDDSTRIASPGVNWKFDDQIVTVLVVACLGYSKEASRGAKVVDTRATEIIVRAAKHGTSAIKFSQMRKVSSLSHT